MYPSADPRSPGPTRISDGVEQSGPAPAISTSAAAFGRAPSGSTVATVQRRTLTRIGVALVAATAVSIAAGVSPSSPVAMAVDTRVPAGQVLRVAVPDAIGGKTVIGQLTVDNASAPGFVTAYACDNGLPRDAGGGVSRSDLNYDGTLTPSWSNRLIVQADSNGHICLFTSTSVDMIIDINAVSFDTGITSFANRRSDTRSGTNAVRGPLAAKGVLRVSIPEAVGGRTVTGQLTIDRATEAGYVTAFACDGGLPRNADGGVSRSDLNYDGTVTPSWSNRLIVQADQDGDICLYTSTTVDMIVDVNGATDVGITSFPNRRTDTRSGTDPASSSLAAGQVLRVSVPEAAGGRTVMGQLTADRSFTTGFVTAFACDDGLPRDADGGVTKSDLNFDGYRSRAWSNRLIVQADRDGDVCFFTSQAADLIVDINGVALAAGIYPFANQRTDTRSSPEPPVTSFPTDTAGIPVWPQFTPLPAIEGRAALTGEPADATVTSRPITAVKIDNYSRARPQFGLDVADAVIEVNVEGLTRFIALFQSELPSQVGPVRSARTADLDIVSAMNRPVFAYSGANTGVTAWIESAASSGLLVDFTALRRPCYSRNPTRPSPHNLILDAPCALITSPTAGPARPLWSIDGMWTAPAVVRTTPDTEFSVAMDGVKIRWAWDPATGTYLRSQDGAAHLAASGAQIAARNVVEIASVHVPSPVDARSPNPITVGSGAAIIHRAGRAITGTWSRVTASDPFVFRDAASGTPIPLDVGTTFIELTRAS